MSNILIFQLFYLVIALYMKFTNQNSSDIQQIYLLICVFLCIRIGFAVMSTYSKRSVRNVLRAFSITGMMVAGTFVLTAYMLPLFRQFVVWGISLLTRGLSLLAGPVYQSISQFVQNRISDETNLKKQITEFGDPEVRGIVDLGKPIFQSGAQDFSNTLDKIILFIIMVVILFSIYKLVKMVKKRNLQIEPQKVVTVNWVQEPIAHPVDESIEYTDEIDKLINLIFKLSDEKGFPKEETQSIRKWASTLPFQVPEEWLKDFENIRYNEATNVQIRSGFIQQSLEINHFLDQITKKE